MNTPIRLFIGYDDREAVAYHALVSSVLNRSSVPVAFVPLVRRQLTDRPRPPLASTDFSDTRFLVPKLCGYRGWAIFMDCDQLMLSDIAELWALRDDRYAVMVRKHDHVPEEHKKFLGQLQTLYTKKNWSSLMLINCAACSVLTERYVGVAGGLVLHQFKWLAGDHLIGDLPAGWNHLVDYDKPNPAAKHVHYTTGGPYFEEYAGCGFSHEWRLEQEQMNYAERRRA